MEPADRAQLVLRQRLRGVDEQHRRQGILDQRLDDGNVVAERLATRRAGHDHDVLSLADPFDRVGLMAVEPADPLLFQRGLNRRGEAAGEIGVRGRPFRQHLHVRNLAAEEFLLLQSFNERFSFHQQRSKSGEAISRQRSLQAL